MPYTVCFTTPSMDLLAAKNAASTVEKSSASQFTAKQNATGVGLPPPTTICPAKLLALSVDPKAAAYSPPLA